MNDGDKALVIQDETFVNVAKRNMIGVVPLYYEMGAAKAEIIDEQLTYDSLIKAFKANIGEVSNNITKVFNSSNEIDLDVVKWLTAENNYIIDFAKTLYMPTRPDSVNERIQKAIKGKVPHFFMEAKSKDKKNVEPLNKSTMNRIRKLIYNKKVDFKNIAGELDYKMLMNSDIQRLNKKIANKFKNLNKNKYRIIKKRDISNKKDALDYVYKFIRDEMKLLGVDESTIVDNLVKDVYENRNSTHKDTLWNCYGDVIVSNLNENLKGTKQCKSCGERIKSYNTKKYCNDCADEILKIQVKENMKKYRKRKAL